MGRWVVLLLFLLTSFVCTSVKAQGPVAIIITPPQSVSVIEGTTTAEFTCTVEAGDIDFLVDGVNAGESSIIDQGFMLSSIDVNGTIRQQNLSAVAVASINNTIITCRASTIEGTDVAVDISDPAVLLIQGPLSSVVDLSYSFIDSSTVNISWSPPFTLPGTDITGYNISATTNGTTINYFTSNSYYELSLTDITDSPCNEVIITVSGYNGLDGENTTLTGIYLDEVSSEGVISISSVIDRYLCVSLLCNVSGLCVGEYPSEANITLYNNVLNENMTKSISLPNQMSKVQVIEVNNVTHLQRFINYTVVVTYSNLAGDFDLGSTLNFNTSDLVFARLLNSSNDNNSQVCVECVFAPFSSSNATCTVKLESSNGTLNDTQTFTKPNATTDSVVGCISTEGLNSTELAYVHVNGQGEITQEIEFSLLIEPNEPITNDTTPSNMTDTHTMSNSTNPPSTRPTDPSTTKSPETGGGLPLYIIIIIILVAIFVCLLIVVIIVVVTCCKNKSKKLYPTENKRGSADGLVGSSSFTDRSPTNPPANMEAMYSTPNMDAMTGKAPIVYAELSAFNKSHSTNGAGQQPQAQSKKDNSQVVYSDLLIKEQPTEIRETRLHSSATVITKTMITHPDEDIEEIFFHHPDNDSDKEDSPSPVYPPVPTGRAPLPLEDSALPVPSRYHGVNPLPVVIQHNRNDSEEAPQQIPLKNGTRPTSVYPRQLTHTLLSPLF